MGNTRHGSVLLVVLALAFAFLAGCGAQPPAPPAGIPTLEPVSYDAIVLTSFEWRNIGPNRGGRSVASTGVPGRPLEAYFGAVGGGLWKTTDVGLTWAPVTDGQIESSSVGSVAVAPSNPDIVYMGMGEACIRGNVMQGDGMYKSTDAGKTWAHIGLPNSQAIPEIVVHPRNPDLVYAAVFGRLSAPDDERGVYRSKNGGNTWDKVLFRDGKTGAIDLVMDPGNPNVLYAALWEAYRVTWQMSSGGPGSGLFKTTDGGNTWTELTRNPGMPIGMIGRIGVAVSVDSRRVYAIVENTEGGVFRTDDAGATWTRVNDDRNLRQRSFYYTHIYADTKDRDTMYVLNVGFFKSTDGGKTYTTIRVPHGDNHNLWIDPVNPLHLVYSGDGGGGVSLNGGQTWTEHRYPTAQLYHVATTKDFPYHVCGAQQDNSTVCVPSDGWEFLYGVQRVGEYMYSAGGGESGHVTPHPTDANVFYAGNQGALLTRYDRSNGQARDIQPYPRFFSGEPSSALPERWQWTAPIVFSPHDPKMLYTCSQHVWRTTNDGQTWEKISPDLTRADPKTLGVSGGPITHDMNGPEIYATVFALAPSKLEPNTMWAGSDDGLIHITRDGGKNWANITPKDLPPFIRVSIIDASVHSAGTAYVAAKHYLQNDRAPYIYKTHDYGQTWTKIVKGIRADDYAHAVREDPKRAGLLYAGTEHGIYASFDDGQNWLSIRLNMPDTQVSDIVVEAKDLVAGTHGRSIYILDDIAPLRQMTTEIAQANVHLFQPTDVVRRVERAAVQYYLKQPADKVTIEILNAQGQVVRTFTGTPGDDQAKPQPTSSRTPVPRPPARKAGLNRFEWDLRYPGATVFEPLFMWSSNPAVGPLAPPGEYQVRLTVGADAQTAKFAVKMDPRIKGVTEADLQAQFDLVIQSRDKVSQANEGVIRIRAIRDRIRERMKQVTDASVTIAGEALVKKITDVEEALYQVRYRSSQDPLNWPIKLNERLAAVGASVQRGDARPTDASRVVFKELTDELATLISTLDGALSQDLTQFNKLVTGQKLEAVSAAVQIARPQ